MLRGGQAERGQKNQHDNAGFTIIELMIATLVFSTIMVVASATVVRYTNAFQRSLTQSNTQSVARSIIDDVSGTLQMDGVGGSKEIAANGSALGYCIDGVRYSYILQQMLRSDDNPLGANRVLVKEEGQGNSCGGQATNIVANAVGAEMLGENMRLMDFTIDPLSGDLLYRVSVKVAYGENDLFDNPTDPNTIQCKGGPGSQFCAVSALSTTVKRRL